MKDPIVSIKYFIDWLIQCIGNGENRVLEFCKIPYFYVFFDSRYLPKDYFKVFT